jgi:hypothetical protein
MEVEEAAGTVVVQGGGGVSEGRQHEDVFRHDMGDRRTKHIRRI